MKNHKSNRQNGFGPKIRRFERSKFQNLGAESLEDESNLSLNQTEPSMLENLSITQKSIRVEAIDNRDDSKELEDTQMQNNNLGFSAPKSYADFTSPKTTSNFLDRSPISLLDTIS